MKGVTGAKGPTHMRALAKAKALGMALYFAGDHLVWAYNTGLLKNKKNQEMVQKASWYGWLLGSVTSVIMEVWTQLLDAAETNTRLAHRPPTKSARTHSIIFLSSDIRENDDDFSMLTLIAVRSVCFCMYVCTTLRSLSTYRCVAFTHFKGAQGTQGKERR